MNHIVYIFLMLFATISSYHGQATSENKFDSVSMEKFEPVFKHSPFTRDMNTSNRYSLCGIVTINGTTIANVYDKNSMTKFWVSEKGSDNAWKLNELQIPHTIESATAIISHKGEIHHVNYQSIQENKNNSSSNSSLGLDQALSRPTNFAQEKSTRSASNSISFDTHTQNIKAKISTLSQEERSAFYTAINNKRDQLRFLNLKSRNKLIKKTINKITSKRNNYKETNVN